MANNFYAVLGVSADATAEQIKAAYRTRAKQLHPDHSNEDSAPFRELQEAYSVLVDPQQRRAHDRQLAIEHRPLRRRRLRAEPLCAAPKSTVRLARQSPSRRPEAVSLFDSFGSAHPSFDELFDRFWSNFESISRPKAEQIESLTLEIPLSPREARRGGTATVMVPARASCPICAGRGAVGAYECWHCEGHGSITAENPVEVPYPAGVQNEFQAQVPLDPFGIRNFYLVVRFRVTDAG